MDPDDLFEIGRKETEILHKWQKFCLFLSYCVCDNPFCNLHALFCKLLCLYLVDVVCCAALIQS